MNNIPSIHFLFRWYIFIYILLWLAAAPTPQSNQILQTVGREEARGRTREHFNGLCIGGDNFLSSLAVEIVCLALWQALSPTHFGEEGGETGWGTSHVGDITWLHTGAPWWGVIFCDIVDLVSQRPPCNPQCDYPVQLKTLRWKLPLHECKGLLKGPGLRPLINNESHPSSLPNGSHLCCHHHANQLSALVQAGFCASERFDYIRLISIFDKTTTSKEPPK